MPISGGEMTLDYAVRRPRQRATPDFTIRARRLICRRHALFDELLAPMPADISRRGSRRQLIRPRLAIEEQPGRRINAAPKRRLYFPTILVSPLPPADDEHREATTATRHDASISPRSIVKHSYMRVASRCREDDAERLRFSVARRDSSYARAADAAAPRFGW